MMPKPVNPGGVPIWVSGTINQRMITRLSRFGAGWIPWGESAKDLGASIARMREGVAATGREPSGIGVVGSLALARTDDGALDIEHTMDPVPGLVAAGVTDFRFSLPMTTPPAEVAGTLEQIVRAFRSVTGRE
jgi:alkanesulfonate monooxygenase SsuD/methylene tetrahydromethanopterin reductase-like flavin-dependent oxidoreductase (luciferase family)